MQLQELPLFSSLDNAPQTRLQTDQPNVHKTIENTLNAIFPQQSEENKITRTKRLLGEIGKSLQDEQIQCIATEFQFLIDTWMDEYERDIFNGMTLKEMLNEK